MLHARTSYDFVSFDIETAKELPNDSSKWPAFWPYGISCAKVGWRDAVDDTIVYETWQSPEGARSMTVEQCQDLVKWLANVSGKGYKIATTNGIGFDFRVLAYESQMHDECVKLAMGHVDFMFIALATKGFPIGLDNLCIGMGVQGKLHKVTLNDGGVIINMSGALAPRLWKQGERSAVLAYLEDDVRSQLEVAEAVQNSGQIKWRTNKGTISRFPSRCMTVYECTQLVEPNTSWMSGGPMLTRGEVLSWTKQK